MRWRGLEPPRELPTSTSRGSAFESRRVCGDEEPVPTPIDASERPLSGRVPQAHNGPDDLASEARALLRFAALREEIPAERARAFAAAVLAESNVGRWALAVLRGEAHAVRALVELAIGIVDDRRPTAAARSAAGKLERWPDQPK